MARVDHVYQGKKTSAARQRLSDKHLDSKARALDARTELLELQLEERRGDLVKRDDVLQQLAFILAKLRSRALSVPSAWSRRLLDISDAREMQQQLQEMICSLLDDLADMPQRCADSEFDDDELRDKEQSVARNGNGKTLVEVFSQESAGNSIEIAW